jgi:hypothetical protein
MSKVKIAYGTGDASYQAAGKFAGLQRLAAAFLSGDGYAARGAGD